MRLIYEQRRHLLGVLGGLAIFWCGLIVQKQRVLPNPRSLNKTAALQTTSNYFTFIRIPKTGSTTLMEFLKQTGLTNINTLLPSKYVDTKSHHDQGMLACMYSHGQRDESAPLNLTKCSHAMYTPLRDAWKEARPRLPPGGNMTMFTIVREPFDRLRSLYYYSKKIEWCKHCNKKLYEQVVHGDFSTWLQILHAESGRSMQYQYVNYRNPQKAIRRISGDSPRVLVYIEECFEASLYLLQKQFSLPSDAVESFLKANVRFNSGSYRNDYEQDELEELRKKAKRWFVDDYDFYYAAVEQFQRQWVSLGMDSSILTQECEFLNGM